MVRIAQVEEERFSNYFRWSGSRYYDHPDGEDLLGKLIFTTKIAAMGGLVIGLMDAYMARPLGIVTGNNERLFRICSKTIPAIGVACAFTITTYYATKLRKKDDEFNYILGAMAGGTVLGSIGGAKYGVPFTFIAGGLAVCKKHYHMKGMLLSNPSEDRAYSTYDKRTLDFSLLPEIKGNWTKEQGK